MLRLTPYLFYFLCLIIALTTSVSVRSQPESFGKTDNNQLKQNRDVRQNWQDLDRVINLWQKSASNYHDRGEKALEIETRLKISQAYISFDKFQLAIDELNKIISLNPSSQKLALVFEKLGNAHIGLNNSQQAIIFYKKSLQHDNKSISVLNNIVEILFEDSEVNGFKASQAKKEKEMVKYRRQSKRDLVEAKKYANRALKLSENNSSSSAVRAIIVWNNLFEQQPKEDLLERGTKIIGELPPSRPTVFTILNWSNIDSNNQESWLNKADTMALSIGDSYASSYVKTELGHFYLKNKAFKRALFMALEAQLLAQSNFAFDSLFRSQRLSGKIYRQTGQNEKALNAYQDAIASADAIIAQSIDYDKISRIIDFKSDLEPVYRSTLDLMLSTPQDEQNKLSQALVIYDKLRLAQLREYFGDNCFEIVKEKIIDPSFDKKNTVLINSIILDDKVYFILQLPDGRKVKSKVDIDKAKLIESAQEWYRNLTVGYSWEFRFGSRLFYDLIIAPFEKELKQANPSTIVFIHDGILRNLPMAALYDGENFLAQKWASVSSIGLEYMIPDENQKSKVLAFGLQTSVQEWPELNNAKEEIEQVREYVGGDIFLNENFTVDNFSQEISQKKYSIVHLATHGYFSGNAETSFLLAYDQKISALKLERILAQSREVIDLLVLSACETAMSSEQSLLGLAGIAVRSGVESVVGSLWQVGDENQLEMIESFYSYLKEQKLNKASALQRAQIEQIELLAHPQKWAALNLIGNF